MNEASNIRQIAQRRTAAIEAICKIMEPYTNETERDTMRRMFREYYHGAKTIDVHGRRDGMDKIWQADWLKRLPDAVLRALEATE